MIRYPDVKWKSEREFYDLHSQQILSRKGFYHVGIIGKTDRSFFKHIISKARIQKGDRVVDLGCGSGYLVDKLRRMKCTSVGISNSAVCITQCKENFPKSSFVVADMEEFRSENATHCLSLESIGGADRQNVFKRTYHNLCVGGIFYIKDLTRFHYEDDKMRESREYWEYYWKYTPASVPEIVSMGFTSGFDLIEFNQPFRINSKPFLKTLKLNVTKYAQPHPHIEFLTSSEFVFRKRPKR